MVQVFQRKVHTEANRKLLCWMDEWYGLTLDEVRKMEADTFAKLNKVSRRLLDKARASSPAPACKEPGWGSCERLLGQEELPGLHSRYLQMSLVCLCYCRAPVHRSWRRRRRSWA